MDNPLDDAADTSIVVRCADCDRVTVILSKHDAPESIAALERQCCNEKCRVALQLPVIILDD